MDRGQFADPPAAYRGVTLWMLNDRLAPEQIDAQLDGFRDAGWGAAITRTFDGLATEYLSDEWMAVLERIVGRAGELGLRVWFQAGYMPNGIPELPERFAQKVLVARAKHEPAAASDEALAEDDAFVYAVRRLPHVLDLLSAAAVRSYLRQAYEGVYAERFGADLGRTVEAVWVDEPSFTPPLLPWSDELPERFARRWGGSIVEDAPCLFARTGDFQRVRHRYWRTVVEMFMQGYFAEVSAWCEARGLKFAGHLMGEDTLCAQIAWTAAAMPAYEHMHVPGIDHLTRSLTWSHGHTADRPGVRFVLTPKQCSSVANQTGRQVALAEMYGVSSEGLTFEDRKWIGNWFALLGINFRCLHGSFYSLRGRRKRIYPPHLSAQQPWWGRNRIVGDYFARVSYAIRQGTFRADVLVIHPIESAHCLFDPLKYVFARPDDAPADIIAMSDELAILSENLMKAHRGFEYGDEGLLARRGAVGGSGLAVGEMTYRAVVLPPLITLRSSTVELLTAFMDAGGAVLSAGDPPTRIDGADDERIEAFNARLRKVANAPDALAAALAAVAPADVELLGVSGPVEDVWLHERAIDGGRIVFLANTSRTEGVTCELRIAAAGLLSEWDAETGEVRPLAQRVAGGGVAVRLVLAPTASRLVVLAEGEGEPAASAGEPERSAVGEIDLSGTWRIDRRAPNALTLDFCRLRQADGDWSAEVPVIAAQEMLTRADYRGPVTLRFGFQAEAVAERIGLIVEQPGDCEIRINGRAVEVAGLPPYVDASLRPIDVTGQVRQGENVVEVARRFEPLGKATFEHGGRFQNLPGVELESVYLIGDFGVEGRLSSRPQRPGCARYARPFVLVDEGQSSAGDLLHDGYPFYAGTISLSRTVSLGALPAGQRALLTLGALHACLADVRVNGAAAGAIAWPPYELDVTGLLRGGDNEIAIELTNTLRNLLGPHHRPAGEPDSAWGQTAYSGAWSPETRTARADWYEDRTRDTDAWTDDYFFVGFGLGRACIRIIE